MRITAELREPEWYHYNEREQIFWYLGSISLIILVAADATETEEIAYLILAELDDHEWRLCQIAL